MRAKLFLITVVLASNFLTNCGGGGNGGGTSPLPKPTVSISASPSSIIIGQSVTLSWSSTNATSCAASGDWSGTKATSGKETVTPSTTGSKTYSLSCSGAGGTGSASASVTVTSPPQMTITLTTATVLVGQTQQFTANQDANWFVNDIQSGNSTLGTIDISGLYTAPPLPPNPATVTVKACSRSNATNCATASVTIVAGPGNFSWLNFYAPEGGTAAGKLAAVAGNGNVVAGVEVTPSGDTDPHVAFVTYGPDGSLLGVWTDPDHSSFTQSGVPTPTAMTYDPVSGLVFAVGYAGDSANLDAHAALILAMNPQNPTSVVLNKTFQFGGMRTEARGISVQDGKIYIAAQSAFEVCNPIGVMGCTGNWVIVTDMQGNTVLQFAVGGGDNTIFNGYRSSISGIYALGDHLWVVGEDIDTVRNGTIGYYLQKRSLTGEPLDNISTTNMFWTTVAEDFLGFVFVVGTTEFGNPDQECFWGNKSYKDNPAFLPFAPQWCGDNSGTVSVNVARSFFLNPSPAMGVTVVGSLSKLGGTDPNDTDGGAISWNENGALLWKKRWSSIPVGSVSSWDGSAPAETGSIVLVGSGTDGNTACGSTTACGTAVIGKWLLPQ
jgi:hypothetical protein